MPVGHVRYEGGPGLTQHDGHGHAPITGTESGLCRDRGAERRTAAACGALFAAAAFDTAAHLHTAVAIRQRHPGLAWIG
ncbi:DUF5987 family protein, partial [Streptomyces sp. NPDC005166]